MVFLIQIGASTACFYPLETERALKRVGELGFSTAEVFFNSFSELRGPLLKAICREQEACKIQVVSVHPFSSGTEPFLSAHMNGDFMTRWNIISGILTRQMRLGRICW